jgi:nicotinamide riboside kinase
VLTGPESTGKTTLARTLAWELSAPWTPDAARLFAESHEAPLSAATVAPIARLCMSLEDDARRTAPALIIRDTDLVSTVVYARHYYGQCPAWIVQEARERRGELYLLCTPDLPWEADGVRDRPDDRDAMFKAFTDTVAELVDDPTRVRVIRGLGDARLEAVRNATQDWLARR